LGLPFTPLTTLVVALLITALVTALLVLLPAAMRRTAAPATCGEAMDVPLMVFVAVVDPIQVLVMLLPGAKRSTQLP
jgi:heme/copper-type cytochrome/quinol oxidase subunit 2